MKHLISLVALSFAVVLTPTLAAADDLPQAVSLAERGRRIESLKQGIAHELKGFDKRLAGANHGNPTLRDLPNAALGKLVLGQDAHDAEAILKLAFAQQDMDEKSPSYGSVPWQMGHPEIKDLNSDEFTSQALGPILTLYGDKLSPERAREIHRHARAFFAAMNRRNFKTPAYTNIFLMRATNMILLGEAVKDTAAADEGYRQLDAWIEFTKANGIHEFDSPTYYYVDLDCMSMGYALAQRPEGKRKFKAILDYFWTDIAANYFPARACISGANSRNYDFLHSWGGLDFALFTEGFHSSADLGRGDLEKVLWTAIPNEKAYHVSEQILALASLPQRIVRQRWDVDPAHDRYQFLTPDFSISSSNGDYCQQDKQIAIELASERTAPVIAVIPDVFDSPYGSVRSPDSSGHNKPTHLKLNPTIVQEKNVILAMIDLDVPKEKKEFRQAETLATNVILPAKAATIVADGRVVTATAGLNEKLSLPAILAVREGNAGAVVCVFLADGIGNESARIELKADADGLKHDVARLAIYHYSGSKLAFAQHSVRVGMLLMAGPARTDAEFAQLIATVKNAKITQTTSGSIWTVGANVADITLEAAHDTKKHSTEYRKVNGKPVEAKAMEVNGEDLAAKIWATLP